MAWNKKIILLVLVFVLPLMAQESIVFQQGLQGYTGCQDAHIFANKPDWNTGAEEGLEVTGNGGDADAKYGLLRFNINSLPLATKIDSAWLELVLVKRRTPQSGNKTLAAYRLNRSWSEGMGNDPVGYDGRLAVTGEVSWLYASMPDQPWSTAGANNVPSDHAALPDAQHLFTPTDPTGQCYVWEITDMVQFWLSHPDSNFGLLLREPVVSAQAGILNFASAQISADSLRPRLHIKLGNTIPQTIAGSMGETHTSDTITITWPYRGDANGNGYGEVSLARAGDAQWGARLAMTKNASAYTTTISGLTHGLYHLRGWINDPDGVQGNSMQTLLNIELTPNSSRTGQLYTTLYSDNRLQVLLTFSDDSNADNFATLEYKSVAALLWQNQGAMTRSKGKFESILTGLTSGQQYDLRVTLHDPDGIEGDSLLVTQIYIPQSNEPVRILSSGRKSFHIQSGSYSVQYDSTLTGAYFWISSSQAQQVVLRCAVVTVLPFQVLHPANIDSVMLQENGDSILAEFNGRWSGITYKVLLDFAKSNPGLIHWQCSLQNAASLAVQNGTVECSFYDRLRKQEISSPVISYVQQVPYCAGLTFGYDPSAVQGTFFYFQNFTALNDYFALQVVGPRECVRLNSSGFGFERPANNRSLRQTATVISDAFLYLTPGKPVSETAIATQFITTLSEIYSRLEKPAVEEIDWSGIATNLIRDLADDRCLSTVYGEKYFRSYVGVPRLHNAEAISQLDVLAALRRYEQTVGEVTELDNRLSQNLYRFYNQEHRTMVNDTPNEGVQEGDSWYAIHIHLGLSRLAKMKDANARTLLFLSLPKLMAFARQVNYEFPVFFRYADNSAISGREPDATGGYIYLMLDAYELSKEPIYLQEALAACEHLSGYGFAYTYEAHFTAATCAALARLYRLTGETRYLEMSYMPFANLMALSWLWECDYGYAKEYRTFFGLSPMAGAGVITMMEQHHSWTYLREYRTLAGTELLPGLQKLLDGFIAYTPTVLKYSLPPFLPSAALVIGPTVYDSYNVASFHIPFEDLRDGWQKSGSLGQQIYGAGGPLVFAAELQTGVAADRETVNNPSSFVLLQNYPNPFNANTVIRYKVPGVAQLAVHLAIFDILGQEVKLLRAESEYPGEKQISWDSKNEMGESVSAGVYFLILQMDGKRAVKKIILLR